MTRYEEIEERLSQIKTEIDAPDANLDALEQEVRALKKEQSDITAAESKRAEMRAAIADGSAVAKVIKSKEDNKMTENRTYAVDSEEYMGAATTEAPPTRSIWRRGRAVNIVSKVR